MSNTSFEYSQCDHLVIGTNVDYDTVSRPAHVYATLYVSAVDVNTKLGAQSYDGTTDTMNASSPTLVDFILDGLSDVNARRIQDVYARAVVCTIYGHGMADSTTCVGIANSLILKSVGVPILETDDAEGNYSLALIKNFDVILKESVCKVNDVLNTSNWVHVLMRDIFSTFKTTMWTRTGSSSDTDFRVSFVTGDVLSFYFKINASTNDNILGSHREGSFYTNPSLSYIRMKLIVSLT